MASANAVGSGLEMNPAGIEPLGSSRGEMTPLLAPLQFTRRPGRAGPRLHFRGQSLGHAVGAAAPCLRPDYPRPTRLAALIEQQQRASRVSGIPKASLTALALGHPDGVWLPLHLLRWRHR